jgi:hypothetical protein
MLNMHREVAYWKKSATMGQTLALVFFSLVQLYQMLYEVRKRESDSKKLSYIQSRDYLSLDTIQSVAEAG